MSNFIFELAAEAINDKYEDVLADKGGRISAGELERLHIEYDERLRDYFEWEKNEYEN